MNDDTESLELSLGSGTYILRFLCKDVAQRQGRQPCPWEHNFDILEKAMTVFRRLRACQQAYTLSIQWLGRL